MKSLKIIFLTALILAIIACDTPMGMGDPIDFDAPELVLLEVELADGEIIEITRENGKMFVGPGILFGKGAVLKGKARDNVEVLEIRAQEIATTNEWITREIGRPDKEGWQSFSLNLSGLAKGERELEITAYDRASLTGLMNIGPDTVKQITLLVDTDPPFVDNAWIERHPGVFASLLPKSTITELENNEFEFIDFFQNEKFTISAEISHEFSLSEVTLNLINEEGTAVVSKTTNENLYAPSWEVTAAEILSASSSYSSGKHYFTVVISAKAEAGHSGQNDTLSNTLFNLCWNPESDTPVIQLKDASEEPIIKNADGVIPVQIFDDDDIEDLRYAVIAENDWLAASGNTDVLKLDNLIANINNTYSAPFTDLNTLRVTPSAQRNRIIIEQIDVGSQEGFFRLIVIARDGKKTGSSITVGKTYRIRVINAAEPPCELISIICENPNGAYKLNDELSFKFIFSGDVYTVGGPASFTLHHDGTSGNQGTAQTINIDTVTKAGASSIMRVTWQVPEDLVFAPVRVTAVDLSNVRRADNDNVITSTDSTMARNIFNTNRTGLKIMSVRPYITHINDVSLGTDSILTPNGNLSSLKLKFSHPVWPENGIIRVRTLATTDYLIPPVLTNDEYSQIAMALGYTAENSPLNTYYTRTTHGLRKNASGAYIDGSPDTSTKFVLNFSENLTGTPNSVTIRGHLNNAKFRWQEIDVTDSRVKGVGTDTIIVDLSKLPDGRIWKIEIVGTDEDNTADGSFRDEAGNTFAGWGAAGKPNATNYRFWSSKTAEPVIRVQRVSNNRAHSGITTDANVIFQRNVNYRIDCETPGAAISYGHSARDVTPAITGATTNTASASRVAAVPDSGDASTYRADSNPNGTSNGGIGYGNSNSTDFTLAQLQGIGAGTNYTANSTLSIGDGNLYTARKDYIAARANLTSPALGQSDFGYEGAFKTVIVYRSPPTDRFCGNFMKIEATDTQNGPVTIAGFPMEMNDMSGNSSKFVYRDGTDNSGPWVWISWEMVSDFWHVAMTVESTNYPGVLHDKGDNDNSWYAYNSDWYNHNYRKYGNYGLRVGNVGTN